MKFSLWTDYGALNSKPVFDAFANSLNDDGHTVVYNDSSADVNVIWSVLFHGRMARNRQVWEHNKPTIVLEVGGINRGVTWKVGLNGINRDAYFGPMGNNSVRANNLGLSLKPRQAGEYILICGQHDKSLQWQDMLPMQQWVTETIAALRIVTERPIIFRPHPRCRVDVDSGVTVQTPNKIPNSYDDFDMSFNNIHATVSWSSNPGIHSVLAGVPAFVSTHSLAYDVANDIDFLHDTENPLFPDRTQWLNDYAHTEYTLEEISQGLPLKSWIANLRIA